MSLYLCLFEGSREIAGVEVGGYDDFNALRQYIAERLEHGRPGSRFPTLMLHSDCDGQWPLDGCHRLRSELAVIIAEMKLQPAIPFPSAWQAKAAAARAPRNALESFVDVEGEVLLEQLEKLAATALEAAQPILFQ